MFRLYDALTGQAVEITPEPGQPLRLYVGAPAANRPVHVGDLRTFLVADLILRNGEHRHNLTVLARLVNIGGSDQEGGGATGTGTGDEFRACTATSSNDESGTATGDALRADAAALNLRPTEQAAGDSGPADPVSTGEIVVGTYRVRSGRVLFEDREMAGRESDAGQTGSTARPVRLPDLAGRGLDPLALRLAFLSGRYRDQADLTWDVLAEADQMLRQWRERVAEWAESASRPVDAEVTARVAAAFDDDLDTPAALRALGELEHDPGTAPGSKFESFVHADQVLALDLPRDIGRAPVRRNNSPS